MYRSADNGAVDFDDFEEAPNHQKMIAKLLKTAQKKKEVRKDFGGVPQGKHNSLQILRSVLKDSGLSTAPSILKSSRRIEKVKKHDTSSNEVIEEKAIRLVNQEQADSNFSIWESVVQSNRLAEHLSFAKMEQAGLKFYAGSTEELKSRLQRSKVKGLEELKKYAGREHEMPGNLRVLAQGYGDIALENPIVKLDDSLQDDTKSKIDLRAFRELVNEKRMLRAKQANVEQKLRHHAKIKSKDYHRRLKRRKLATEKAKETAEQQADPDAFEEKARLTRIEERMSQKHRAGSKFARHSQAHFRKHDELARAALHQMHDIAQQRTKKVTFEDNNSSTDEDESDFDSKMKSIPEEDDKIMLPIAVNNKQRQTSSQQQDDSGSSESEEMITQSLKRKKEMQDFSDAEDDKDDALEGFSLIAKKRRKVVEPVATDTEKLENTKKIVSLDKRIFSSTTSDNNAIAANFTDSLDTLFNSDLQQPEEADLTAEFATEKADVTKSEQPADIDLFIPGWNCWAGPGLEAVNARRREQSRDKYVVLAPRVKRRDEGRKGVIIKEHFRKTDAGAKKYMLKEIPFPYNTPAQYAESMQQSLSAQFVSPAAHHLLIKPRISTRMGAIIKPMNASVLIKSKNHKGNTDSDTISLNKKRRVKRSKGGMVIKHERRGTKFNDKVTKNRHRYFVAKV